MVITANIHIHVPGNLLYSCHLTDVVCINDLDVYHLNRHTRFNLCIRLVQMDNTAIEMVTFMRWYTAICLKCTGMKWAFKPGGRSVLWHTWCFTLTIIFCCSSWYCRYCYCCCNYCYNVLLNTTNFYYYYLWCLLSELF